MPLLAKDRFAVLAHLGFGAGFRHTTQTTHYSRLQCHCQCFACVGWIEGWQRRKCFKSSLRVVAPYPHAACALASASPGQQAGSVRQYVGMSVRWCLLSALGSPVHAEEAGLRCSTAETVIPASRRDPYVRASVRPCVGTSVHRYVRASVIGDRMGARRGASVFDCVF